MKHYSEEELYSYIDGELDSQARDDIDQHLISCDSCSQVISAWQALQTQLAACQQIAHSQDFTAQVMTKILPKAVLDETPQWKDLLFAWLSPTVQLSATIILLLYGQTGSSTYIDSSSLFAALDPTTGEELLIIDPYNTDSLSVLLEEI